MGIGSKEQVVHFVFKTSSETWQGVTSEKTVKVFPIKTGVAITGATEKEEDTIWHLIVFILLLKNLRNLLH